MDLAFIAKSLAGTGGTEHDLNQLIRGLLARGHRVTAYVARRPGEGPAGCRRVRVPVLGFGAPAEMWSLAWLGPRMAFGAGHDLVIGFSRLLRQDIVRCGGGSHAGYLESLEAAGLRFASRVRRLQPKHQSILAIERLQYRPGHYRRVLAISGVVKDDLMRVYGIPEKDITVILDGVDTARFHPGLRVVHRIPIRAAFGIRPDARCALFIGNCFRRKGLECLLRAAAVSRDPGLHILVVGSDPDQTRYRRLAARLGIAARVTFAGLQPEPERFYGAADLLVLPAVQEAFGNVVLEALASGIPVVLSRSAGAAEIVKGELSAGLLANVLDPEECAVRIGDVLSREPCALAECARKTAEACSVDVHIDKTEAVFQEVLAAREGEKRCQTA